MEDARKHLLRRPSLGVRGEKMGGGGGYGVQAVYSDSIYKTESLGRLE